MSKTIDLSWPKMDKITGNSGKKHKIRGEFAVTIMAIKAHQIRVSGV